MKEKLLKKALEQAKKKEQLGIIIYANEVAYNDIHRRLKKGYIIFDDVLEKLSKNTEATVTSESCGLQLIAFIALPVKKLSDHKEYFDEKLKYCDKYHIEGPLVFIPSNEVVKVK